MTEETRQPRYKRVLLKLSGEALTGGRPDTTFDAEVLLYLARQLERLRGAGVEVAVVLGGGNLFRGAALALEGVSRVGGDYMGMLATIINGLALLDVLGEQGLDAEIYTSFQMPAFAHRFTTTRVDTCLREGRIAILAGGTGNPFFTTDSAAALRGAELEADVLLKATKVDGVYDQDPVEVPGAKRYDRLTFQEVIEKDLRVMDQTAIALCREVGLPIRVFRFSDAEAFERIAHGDGEVGTLVSGA